MGSFIIFLILSILSTLVFKSIAKILVSDFINCLLSLTLCPIVSSNSACRFSVRFSMKVKASSVASSPFFGSIASRLILAQFVEIRSLAQVLFHYFYLDLSILCQKGTYLIFFYLFLGFFTYLPGYFFTFDVLNCGLFAAEKYLLYLTETYLKLVFQQNIDM